MDVMATTASSQRPPNFGKGRGEPLLFYSVYHTADNSSIDVLVQDVGRIPSSTDPCFGYYFPPPADDWGRHRSFTRVSGRFRYRNTNSSSLLVSTGSFGFGSITLLDH